MKEVMLNYIGELEIEDDRLEHLCKFKDLVDHKYKYKLCSNIGM